MCPTGTTTIEAYVVPGPVRRCTPSTAWIVVPLAGLVRAADAGRAGATSVAASTVVAASATTATRSRSRVIGSILRSVRVRVQADRRGQVVPGELG